MTKVMISWLTAQLIPPLLKDALPGAAKKAKLSAHKKTARREAGRRDSMIAGLVSLLATATDGGERASRTDEQQRTRFGDGDIRRYIRNAPGRAVRFAENLGRVAAPWADTLETCAETRQRHSACRAAEVQGQQERFGLPDT